jgi:hypothetical protein
MFRYKRVLLFQKRGDQDAKKPLSEQPLFYFATGLSVANSLRSPARPIRKADHSQGDAGRKVGKSNIFSHVLLHFAT